MKLKKTAGLLLALTLSAGAFAPFGTHISARADELLPPPAEDSVVTFTTENASLHLPETYEQYLPLENPTSLSIGKSGEIAIADGANIYYYDPNTENPQYKRCTPKDSSTNAGNISKIQFSESGDLYFSSNAYFYSLNPETMEVKIIQNFPCSSFLFASDKLFVVRQDTDSQRTTVSYISESLLSSDSFDGETVEMESVASYNTNHPIYLTYHEEKNLLYAAEQLNVYIYDMVNGTKKTAVIDSSVDTLDLNSVATYKGKFYYTVNGQGKDGGLYTTNIDNNPAERLKQGGKGFTSLVSCNDDLYCIYGGTIRKMSVTENGVEFSGYEIAKNSDSPYRLSNAGETVRTKDLVAIADTDNNRISVYNRLDGSYTTIDCIDQNGDAFQPEHIAIDKEDIPSDKWNDGNVETDNKIAVSSGNKIYEYNFERHTKHNDKNGITDKTPEPYETKSETYKVKGLTYVYGECYYITENNGYGSTDVDSATEFNFSPGDKTPTAIASDVYGTIYVTFVNQVYTFTEADFRKNGAIGEQKPPLSDSGTAVYTSLSVDYEGNVWHLDDAGNLYCNNEIKAQINGKDFVYTADGNDEFPTSFALSFEDDEIYFNFRNYVIKTNAYALESLPSLNKITAGEAKTKTFELAACDNLFVKVPAGSVRFEISLDEFKTGESEYFPYESYSRTETDRRGVLLYTPKDENGYYVIALYDAHGHSFTANLFKRSQSKIEPDENYFEEADDTAYASSSVSLCSAPALFPAAEGKRLSPLSDYLLERGTKVNVLGYAEGEDRVYAYVEVANDGRETAKGFVPRSYLTKNDPLGVVEKTYKLGYLLGDAGVILKGENGEELEIKEDTQVKLYENDDGTYTAVMEKDGVVYSNVVLSDQISHGETDALRISLIVILSVLALVIIGGYIFLMFPKKKKK